jgi:hypothetical protein
MHLFHQSARVMFRVHIQHTHTVGRVQIHDFHDLSNSCSVQIISTIKLHVEEKYMSLIIGASLVSSIYSPRMSCMSSANTRRS